MQSHNLDKINVHFLDNSKKTLPLVISPRFDDSHEFICAWLKDNRQWVHDQMMRYGAVLIRGFQIESASDFEKATMSMDPNLCDKYRGTSPRSLHDGTKYVFSAADVPVNYPIAQHLEMSFLKAPPKNLYFCCVQESKSTGGETALCDFRKVYQDLSPKLRNKFLSKKIKYTRKNYKIGEKWTYDVGAMKTWIDLFGTSDKKEVETICNEEDAPKVQWIGPNEDTFLQEWIDEPFQLHPSTKELVWFNHSQVFHWSTFPAELWYALCRMRDFRLFIHFLLVSIFTFVKYGFLGYRMSLDTTFGDDTPISLSEMNEIRSVIHKHMVFSRWSKGDVLCIDNFSTSHGRQPTYDRNRKVIVSWSQPQSKVILPAQQITSSETTSDCCDVKKLEDSSMPDLLAVTPDSTPDSSLTKQEAEELQNCLRISEVNKKLQSQIRNRGKVDVQHRHSQSCPSLFAADSDFWKSE